MTLVSPVSRMRESSQYEDLMVCHHTWTIFSYHFFGLFSIFGADALRRRKLVDDPPASGAVAPCGCDLDFSGLVPVAGGLDVVLVADHGAYLG